jgi:hypothetical protein
MTNITTVTKIRNLFDFENDQKSNYTDATETWMTDVIMYLWMIMAWLNMLTTMVNNDGPENIT